MLAKGSNLPEPNEKDIASLVQGLDNLCWNLRAQADLLTLALLERSNVVIEAVPALLAGLMYDLKNDVTPELDFFNLHAAYPTNPFQVQAPVFRIS